MIVIILIIMIILGKWDHHVNNSRDFKRRVVELGRNFGSARLC